jgi:hypothetical protein
MRFPHFLIVTCAFLAIPLAPGNADTFDWSYTGTGISGNGTFDATLVSGDTYLVSSATGTVNGFTVTLAPVGSYGLNDNDINPNSTPQLTYNGVALETSGGLFFNLSMTLLAPMYIIVAQ